MCFLEVSPTKYNTPSLWLNVEVARLDLGKIPKRPLKIAFTHGISPLKKLDSKIKLLYVALYNIFYYSPLDNPSIRQYLN